jgi:hypothetical protein
LMLFLEMINLPSGQPKNLKKPRHKGGKEINNPILYDHWADLYKIRERIKLLKKDLERDCKAYWKYDALAEDIQDMQKLIIQQDILEEVK